MSSARDAVLAAIRAGLAVPSEASPRPPAELDRSPPLPAERLAELFVQRATGSGANVTTCATGGVAEALRDACARHHAERLVIPDGLPQGWRPAGCELLVDAALSPSALDAMDGSITGATAAIAESGTVVLDGSADQGRRALTLIPDLHLCVVAASQIVATLAEALELLAPSIRSGRRAITLVSGPSATADIELSRVQGVHGPRHLEIILVA